MSRLIADSDTIVETRGLNLIYMKQRELCRHCKEQIELTDKITSAGKNRK